MSKKPTPNPLFALTDERIAILQRALELYIPSDLEDFLPHEKQPERDLAQTVLQKLITRNAPFITSHLLVMIRSLQHLAITLEESNSTDLESFNILEETYEMLEQTLRSEGLPIYEDER